MQTIRRFLAYAGVALPAALAAGNAAALGPISETVRTMPADLKSPLFGYDLTKPIGQQYQRYRICVYNVGGRKTAGVTHPDGRPFEIGIGAITQDEPVNGVGDGNTSPDGTGVGTPKVQVRAERAGPGNGRVYRISFTATDDLGASCEGAVTVGVPHDRRPGSAAIDDGQNHDSTTGTAKGGACGKHPWQRC